MAEPAADARPLETSGLEAGAEAAARVLRLFANEHRLRLMCRLADGDHSVGDLALRRPLAVVLFPASGPPAR